jgi:short-subunit dehydrogenase
MAILFLGATSEIARYNVDIFAAREEHLILVGRDMKALRNLKSRPDTELIYYNASETLQSILSAEMFWLQCVNLARVMWEEPITGIYIAQGMLPSQELKLWGNEIEQTIFINFTSLAIFLETVAHWYETHIFAAKGAWITVISSVAGDRGRYSNYPYGAAKAGLTAYLSGLRARLRPLGTNVLTVKPGLVQTRMIASRPQAKSFFVADPRRVAESIDRAIVSRRSVLYTPWWWRLVMSFVQLLPECIFKRLRF